MSTFSGIFEGLAIKYVESGPYSTGISDPLMRQRLSESIIFQAEFSAKFSAQLYSRWFNTTLSRDELGEPKRVL